MRGRIILTALWVSSVMLTGGAQIPSDNQKPVWTMELVKVKPSKLGAAMDYLDYHWIRVREEAEREGAVLSYHRIADQGGGDADPTIVLLTEYKNQVTYNERERLFSSIVKSQGLWSLWHDDHGQEIGGNFPGIMLDYHADLFETVSTRIYNDYTEAEYGRVHRVRPVAGN